MHKLCLTCARREKNFHYRSSCNGKNLSESTITFGPAGTCSLYFNKYVWRKEEKKITIEKKKTLTHNPFSILKGV